MHNANKPNPDDLPSTAQLLRSTVIAIVAALLILVTIVLPAEYGIDPTRVGGLLGLAEMGEIKTQLAEEAEADHSARPAETRNEFSLLGIIIPAAHAHASHGEEEPRDPMGRFQPWNEYEETTFEQDTEMEAEIAAPEWTDVVTLTLEPGEGKEVKLVMEEGAVAEYMWIAEGGVVNYDLHGDGSGNETSYQRDRGVPGDEGTFTAAFTGNHGWFWRNRDRQSVTVTLHVRGAYTEVVTMYE